MSGQLAWLDYMERIERECFPDARPRSEVMVLNMTDLRSPNLPRTTDLDLDADLTPRAPRDADRDVTKG